MRKKYYFFITILTIIVGLVIPFSNNTNFGVAADEKSHYTITTDSTYPPFDFQKEKQKEYVGIDMDLLKEIAKIENFTYSVKPMSFNMAAQTVANGQADGIIAGMAITPEREKIYDVSTPYFKTGVVFAVAKNSKIKSYEDLKGKKVALKTGTAAANYALELQKKYNFDVTYFNDSNIMYNDVIEGNSVACFEDQPVMQYGIQTGLKLKIPDQKLGNAGSYGFFVKKGQNSQLLKKFNHGLKKLQDNGKYDQIVDRYLGSAKNSVTKEKKGNLPHSNTYFRSGFIWAVNKDAKIKNIKDLKNKTVALKTGTGSADYAKSIQKKYGFKIKYFNDSNTMYNDVVVGNSVACFEDEPVMRYAIKNGINLTIPKQTPANTGEYAFAVQKGKNAALLKAFNIGLKELKKSGKYDQIKAKYLGSKADTNKEVGNTKEDNSVWGLLSSNREMFLSGLGNTMLLTVFAILIASVWGLILGIMGVSENRFVRGVYSTIIYIFRGLPLLVLAFFIYIGLPNLTGVKISTFAAGLLTLVLNEGAYTGAFVKGGFDAVDPGQMEAARALGVPYNQAMRGIIMPQGLKIMIPSFINQFIITLKDTSIISAIGFVELTQTGQLLVARTQKGFAVYGIVALIYLIVITVLTWLSKFIEKRLGF